MRNLLIWIDDERIAPKELFEQYLVITCASYHSAIAALKRKPTAMVDLDYDLGEDKTGYDIAKFIVENQLPIAGFRLHTMNAAGRDNMRQLLTHYGYKEYR